MTRATAKQMELFEDGGLKDEGGTVDPVSGNDVPPGSTKAEVRDDIPAQLSEGEFVFPADVVRFIGLEKLMKIRQRAKAGLQRMEDMGQMGNSEEAIMPDDLPFSIDDLDMEDDGLEMNQGGLVNMSNGGLPTTGFPQVAGTMGMNPTVPTAPAPMQAASSLSLPPTTSGVDPNLAGTTFTPTTIQPITVPFQEAKGPGVVGVEQKNVVYVNEAGQERTFIVKSDGTIIDPTTQQVVDPATLGFKVKTDETKTQTTTGTGVKTAQVRDDGDGGAGDEGITTGASIALGGKAVGPAQGLGIPGTRFAGPSRRVKGATIYDVSFKNVGLKNMLNPAGFAFNMIKEDGGLPPGADAVVGVRGNKKATIELPAVAYNTLRNNPRGQQAKTVQEALAARDALTSGNKASYVDGVLSVENKDGDMVTVSKEAIDLIGSTMYSEIKAEADGTFGFGKTDNLVDTASDYYSGMSDTEEQNARNALSAYNDQQFSDFISQDEVYGDTNEGQQDDNTSTAGEGDAATGGSVSEGDMYSGDG